MVKLQADCEEPGTISSDWFGRLPYIEIDEFKIKVSPKNACVSVYFFKGVWPRTVS